MLHLCHGPADEQPATPATGDDSHWELHPELVERFATSDERRAKRKRDRAAARARVDDADASAKVVRTAEQPASADAGPDPKPGGE